MTRALQVRERSVEDFEEKIGVLFVDAHWWREPDRLTPKSAFAEKQAHFFAGLHDLRAFFLGRLLRLSIFHQLDPEQQSFAAHIADDVVFFSQLSESGENPVSDLERICLELFAIDYVEDRTGLRADNRISPESVEVYSLRERRGNFRSRHNRTHWTTVTNSLRHRHDVGNNILGFESPIVTAGAAETRLHFVGDAQTASN